MNAANLNPSAKTGRSRRLRFWLALLLLLALAPLALCAQPLLILFNGCRDLSHYRQDVDVAPLLNIQIPADMDLAPWMNKRASLDALMGRNGVWTDVRRWEDLDTARHEFQYRCTSRFYKPSLADFAFGGERNDRFCVSYVQTARADPEGLCSPLGYYYSYAVVQRGDVVISVYERSEDQKSRAKDEAIQQLAREIEAAASGVYTRISDEKRWHEEYGCTECHSLDGSEGIGPTWWRLYGSEVRLSDGRTVLVDLVYLRRAIFQTEKEVVEGYQSVMPRDYARRLPEQHVSDIMVFIKSFGREQ